MTFKKAVGKIHLWLGFIAGGVVVVSMLAAALFVWEEELTDWYYHDQVFVSDVKSNTIPVDDLLETVRKAVPGKEVYGTRVSRDPARSYVFTTYKKAEHPGWSWMSGMDHYDFIYADQYSGKILGIVDKRYDWITMTRMLHQCLLLNYDVGHLVVGIATLIVIVMSVTGIVLWWPKNKAALKQRFTIKWNAKWRRLNYDLHNVGGFYTNLVILLLAVTGLVWTFDWWTNGIYRMLGNDPKEVFARHEPPEPSPASTPRPGQLVLSDAIGRRATWTTLYLNFPRPTEGKAGEFSVFVRFDDDNGWDESDNYYYHGQTGLIHHTRKHEQKLLGEKWRNSNYAIHVGSIYGWPTKLLACFAALFLSSLPITGFYIWWGRKVKSKRGEPVSGRQSRSKMPRPPVPVRKATV